MTESKPGFTRRDLLAGGALLALGGGAPTARAQPRLDLPGSSRELWQWVRTQPVLDLQSAWLDSAGGGPTLRAAMAAEYRARDAQSFFIAGFDAERWRNETRRLAARAAAFAGCDAGELKFTHGAGEALAQIAMGLDLNAGDEIITTTREHPAAVGPWLTAARRRGVIVRQIEIPAPVSEPAEAVGLFAAAVTERTRAIMFSHVNYADGAVMPVRELCDFARSRGVLSIVDGAQALGMIEAPLRDLNCDFYATCFHKWLGGASASGILYVRRDMLDRIWPTAPRSMDVLLTEPTGEPEIPATIGKLGNIVPHAWPALRAMEAAMELHEQIGRARIEARVRELAIYARMRLQQLQGVELLTPARPGLWGGILAFRTPGVHSAETAGSLVRGDRVHIRDLTWPGFQEGVLRASFHMFNTHDEVDRMTRGLERVLRLASRP